MHYLTLCFAIVHFLKENNSYCIGLISYMMVVYISFVFLEHNIKTLIETYLMVIASLSSGLRGSRKFVSFFTITGPTLYNN